MTEVEAVSVAPLMGVSCLALLVVAALVLVGVIGLVLLIVGLVKRRPALWISGIVVMVLAGLVLVVGIAAVAIIAPLACRPVETSRNNRPVPSSRRIKHNPISELHSNTSSNTRNAGDCHGRLACHLSQDHST